MRRDLNPLRGASESSAASQSFDGGQLPTTIDGRMEVGGRNVQAPRSTPVTPNETTMRRSVMLGTALIVIGGAVFLRELSAPTTDQGRELGDGVVATGGPSPTVLWATGLAAIAGLVLVYAGRRRRPETWLPSS
jgi:hypothetical protein